MLSEIAHKLRTGETSSRELTERCLARIRAHNDTLHAFITVCETEAMEMAAQADRRIRAGDASILCGIPMALKDNIATEGIRTTCASRMLADFVPPYSAFVWERLRAEGAVLLGKTNMDEFAMGGGGENSAFGVCRNPRDPARTPGGSSSGSAVAVAAGMAYYALGSDTGGSVRVPAAFCGVTGIKPTYGRVSRRGLVAFASSLDQIGVLAKSVADSACVLDAISAWDAADSTMTDRPATFLHAFAKEADVCGMRIGVPADLDARAETAEVQAVRRVIDALVSRGALQAEALFPDSDRAYAAYYILSSAEASSNLARYDGLRYGAVAPSSVIGTFEQGCTEVRTAFGTEVQRRILAGTAALSAENRAIAYDRAQCVRRQIAAEMDALFTRFDVLVTPTVPKSAWILGEAENGSMPYAACDAFTTVASLSGLPAISLAVDNSDGLLPGIQIMAPAWREDLLYRAARVIEEEMAHA